MTDNRIVAENAIVEGRTSQDYWDVPHSDQIEGFTTDISVNAGTTVDFKINVNGDAGSDYRVEVFRLGYYGGAGAREVAAWTNTDATVQPEALYDETRALVDAGNWSVTDSWQVPADAVSGVYLARLQRLDANGTPIEGAVNQIPFIVRNDGVPADIVLQTSDTTWHAYNGWFGNNGQVGANFYGDASGQVDHPEVAGGAFAQDRAYAVSYNRPFITRDGTSPASGGQDYLFGADYAAIYWLEKNGYDVSYISGVDTDRLGADYLQNYKAFISVGHDEYWSGDQRANVEEARDAGVNLLFWSGNEVYWKTRWETAISADGTEYRTLVCYKETWANADPNAAPEDYADLDPTNIWTGTWRDTRFLTSVDENGNYNAGGADPDPISGLLVDCHCVETLLTGQLFGPDGTGEFGGALDVPLPMATLRVWRDTSIAEGGVVDLAPGLIGYEWNTAPTDDTRPAGLIRLSDSLIPWSAILVDAGNTTEPGVETHNLTLYRAESGALVFAAGTVFWSWALSDRHDSSPYGAEIENTDLQQFVLNIFADMGIQPGISDAVLATAGLVRATGSTDVTGARATLDALPSETTALSTLVLSGTATDNDGNPLTEDGQVALVEVSVDGGETWRIANSGPGGNWSTWSLAWRPATEGVYTVLVRAIDDSLNLVSATLAQATVTVVEPELPDSFSLFDPAGPSGAQLFNDNTPLELGMRFTVAEAGMISALRYWRAEGDASDTDVRTGHLWSQNGVLLGSVTFSSAPGQSGWQVAALDTPVALTPGSQYVVSYRTEDNYVSSGGFFNPANEIGFDGLDDNAFTDPFGMISAGENSGGAGNGLYVYGSTPVMPNATYQGANYWVDVVYVPVPDGPNGAPSITSPAAYAVAENQLAAGVVSASDPDGNAVFFSIAGGADAALFAINATTGALGFVAAPNFEAPGDADGDNVYEVTVRATDNISSPVTQAVTVTVTDVDEPPASGATLFGSAAPSGFSNDPTDYELGTRFATSESGFITSLRYYRGAADSGDVDTRTLSLWSANGSLIATAVVTSGLGETGWQEATLSTAVAVQAGTGYIVSYGYDQDGTADAYAFTSGYFATAHSSPDGVLTAPASGSPNGLSSGGTGNGLFGTTVGDLPQYSYFAANYWVDVSFTAGPAPNAAPVFTSAGSFLAAENQTQIGAVTASDGNGDPLTFVIAGGADAALFEIDADTGALTFVAPPDFEAPGDADANNIYAVTVAVWDGIADPVQQTVTVRVTNLPDTPGSSLEGSQIAAQYVFGSTATSLFPSSGASQTATVDASPGSVEFVDLPPPGPSIGNGSFGLATVDIGAQSVRIEFPLDAGVFPQASVPFAPASAVPFNGVRISDPDGQMPDILGMTIIDQMGFTTSGGAPLLLTEADFEVTADAIFLNMAGYGRLVDADPVTGGQQHAYVVLELDLASPQAPAFQGEIPITPAFSEDVFLF